MPMMPVYVNSWAFPVAMVLVGTAVTFLLVIVVSSICTITRSRPFVPGMGTWNNKG